MLQELALTNFKGFHARQRIPLAPLTLIYGPNSGGKSSLLHALMLLRQCVDEATTASGLVARGSRVDLGSFSTFVHAHDTTKDATIEVSFDAPVARASVRSIKPLFLPADVVRRIAVSFGRCKVPIEWSRGHTSGEPEFQEVDELKQVSYALGDTLRLSVVRDQGQRSRLYRWCGEADVQAMSDFAIKSKLMTSREVQRDADAQSILDFMFSSVESPSATEAIPDEALQMQLREGLHSLRERYASVLERLSLEASRMLPSLAVLALNDLESKRMPGDWQDFFQEFEREWEGTIRSIFHVAPVRERPGRTELAKDIIDLRSRFGSVGVRVLNGHLAKCEIPYRLSIHSVKDDVIGDVETLVLTDTRTGSNVSLVDVGFGISQLLPILAEAITHEPRVLLIEQPEIHLHPRLQAHLGDFLAECSGIWREPERAAKDPAPKKPPKPPKLPHRFYRHGAASQCIVETHSETLMLRVQRRIREGSVSSDDVCVLYVEGTSQGAQVRRLRLDEHGDFIDEWPQGFFEDAHREMFPPTP